MLYYNFYSIVRRNTVEFLNAFHFPEVKVLDFMAAGFEIRHGEKKIFFFFAFS